MYKIFSDISFMCRTYTEIHLQASILVLLLEQVRTLGRAKARLGRRHSKRKVDQSTTVERVVKKVGQVHEERLRPHL